MNRGRALLHAWMVQGALWWLTHPKRTAYVSWMHLHDNLLDCLIAGLVVASTGAGILGVHFHDTWLLCVAGACGLLLAVALGITTIYRRGALASLGYTAMRRENPAVFKVLMALFQPQDQFAYQFEWNLAVRLLDPAGRAQQQAQQLNHATPATPQASPTGRRL